MSMPTLAGQRSPGLTSSRVQCDARQRPRRPPPDGVVRGAPKVAAMSPLGIRCSRS